MIPFGQYAPDQPILGSEFASIAKNVVPVTARSYGPLNDLGVTSDALTARAQGGFSCKDTTGASHNFTGDATKLYKLTSSSTWEDVSKGGGYTVAAEEFWEFILFNEYVVAVQQGNAPQSFQLGTSTDFADLSASAPTGKHVGKIDPGFVMIGNLTGLPNRVHWGEFGDPTSWPTVGTAAAEAAQSNLYDLPSGGAVQRIVGAVGGADGLIFMENAIYRLDYVGPPGVFEFHEIERGRGVDAPHSIVNVGPFAFYLGVDGFKRTDGGVPVSIGEGRVDATFLADVDDNFINRVVGCLDPVTKLIFWIYPSNSTGGGACDRVMIYHYELDRWSYGEIATEYVYPSLSQGFTLEGLDSISASLDALPLSLDHRAYAGGRTSIAAFTTAHKLAYFTGSALAATVETGEFDSANTRVFGRGIRPLVDTDGTVTAAIGYRDTPGGSVTFTSATSRGADGVCPQRIDARYAKARVSVAAAATWTHAQGIEVLSRRGGKR